MTTIGIPKEIHPGEKRVAATPQTIIKLKKLGFDVAVESGAGHGINTSNSEYREAGAAVIEKTSELWALSDVILKVRPPEQNEELGVHEADLIRDEKPAEGVRARQGRRCRRNCRLLKGFRFGAHDARRARAMTQICANSFKSVFSASLRFSP